MQRLHGRLYDPCRFGPKRLVTPAPRGTATEVMRGQRGLARTRAFARFVRLVETPGFWAMASSKPKVTHEPKCMLIVSRLAINQENTAMLTPQIFTDQKTKINQTPRASFFPTGWTKSAPIGRRFPPIFMGFPPSQLAQIFIHPWYVQLGTPYPPSSPENCMESIKHRMA